MKRKHFKCRDTPCGYPKKLIINLIIKNMEKTVETKNCKQCNIEFTISDKELEFYKKISPKF